MKSMNYRMIGRLVLSLMAITTLVGALITFYDHAPQDLRRPLQSISMAILTLAFVQAIRCLED